MDRRSFLRRMGLGGAALGAATFGRPFTPRVRAESTRARTYHVCMSPETISTEPDRLALVAQSGVTDVWAAGFFYGYWPTPPEQVRACLDQVEAAGMAAHVVNVPLGHPGDSLGSPDEEFPLTPSRRWRLAVRPDGSAYSGTSLHPPATEDNCAALRRLAELGVRAVFLDDDFRLATGPGVIGGCFCDEHRDAFLKSNGYGPAQWDELLADVAGRNLSPVLRAWVEFTCDELTASFRAQQAAAPGIELGNMVMYFGAEKAGIRLADYRGVPLRVGELMFNDASFNPVKNKTGELFSCLFHRRHVTPEQAYSETTAYPADQLSARNMAAKLAVSTIADVRHTMYMSGLTPFPRAHWDTLAPAMKKNAAIHARLAGHAPRGPFKHYWGEHSRYVGDDNPFSLYLAAGVPFEVTDTLAPDGWTFLSDFDARAATASASPGTTLIARPGANAPGCRAVEEDLPALFALKHELLPGLREVPHVEEDVPVVCAWYPGARAVLLWNLGETGQTLTVRVGDARRTVELDGLDLALLEDIG